MAPRAIAVASQKGGVGKTTTAVNLAATLGLAGRQVLLIDLDPQANATSGVGVGRTPERDVGYLAAMIEGRPLRRFVVETPVENLSLLPSSPELNDLRVIQRLVETPVSRLEAELLESLGDFEYVLIDCPPTLLGPPLIALHMAHSVIVPVQCEYYAMEGLSQILPKIQEIAKNQKAGLRIEGLLLTMFSAELELAQDVTEEIRGYFGEQTFQTVVPRDVALAESASHGVPVLEYAPQSRGAWSYVELAMEVMRNGEA